MRNRIFPLLTPTHPPTLFVLFFFVPPSDSKSEDKSSHFSLPPFSPLLATADNDA